MEMRNANRSGKYIIGNVDKTAKTFLTQTAQLELAVSFQIDDGESEDTLKLGDIEEIQSRLMLLGHATRKSHDEEKEAQSDDRERTYFFKVG